MLSATIPKYNCLWLQLRVKPIRGWSWLFGSLSQLLLQTLTYQYKLKCEKNLISKLHIPNVPQLSQPNVLNNLLSQIKYFLPFSLLI